ncbi:MAG: hypothetical protein A3H98_12100 [Bacteroidetes bacterium RIFCSPLOWO2_02_FULL_36_8]|nr:MAG: hypothetical protein A3H98_12100 [Bacteroidetes bacterium RIFCSPLOWO2_02_FULL_36_8]OFY71300.1 MAG: hypothetical protein A3G23_02105 [Bacteroidetes bacterium RIFCSPLOWO2_12_FULL_37_12]
MTCTNCAKTISHFLEKEKAQNIQVDFITGEASFYLDEKISFDKIRTGINSLGYKAREKNSRIHSEHDSIHDFAKQLKIRFFIALIFTLPLFSTMIFHLPFNFTGTWVSYFHIFHNQWSQLLLCLPVYFIGAIQFGKSAWHSLKEKIPNMDVLIITGSSAAFIYSVLAMFWGGDLYFETSASIITLVLLGNLLEKTAVKKTTHAIEQLSKLQPNIAKRIVTDANGNEKIEETGFEKIAENDILVLHSGDAVPVDGVIEEGTAVFDESMITGESIPVSKKNGNKVYAGTLVSDGNLKYKATGNADNSMLSKIIELVKSAQQSKPEIQAIGDKISSIFVPVVIGISFCSLITMFIYHSFFNEQMVAVAIKLSVMSAIAVLVISCPCAMGLATPTALIVGIGRAARNGILIKGGKTLEKFANIKTIVFDKTGTLTNGEFRIRNIKMYQNNDTDMNTLIYNIEKHSSHVIAKSLAKNFHSEKVLSFKTITEQKGIGMLAVDENNREYKIGSKEIVIENIECPHDIYVVEDGKILAGIDMEDELKPDAVTIVQWFKSKGIQPVLLSGDKKEKCIAVANRCGIEKVFYEKLPDEKLSIIEKLTSEGFTAMVGDGINDAPALSKATIGVSLSNATDIAIHSADIVLLHGKLNTLVTAFQLSRKTLQTIKQNLFWAFFYNVVAIPVAFVGLLQPIIGAAAMALSDVVVIGNSLRLRYK